MSQELMLNEKLATLFGWVAVFGGSVGAAANGLKTHFASHIGPQLVGAVDPNSVSAWTLVMVNALTAIGGGICLVVSNVRKTAREQKLADFEAEKATRDDRLMQLQAKVDQLQEADASKQAMADQRQELYRQRIAAADAAYAAMKAQCEAQAAEMKVLRDTLAQLRADQDRVTAAVRIEQKKRKAIETRVGEVEKVQGSTSNLELPASGETALDLPNVQ